MRLHNLLLCSLGTFLLATPACADEAAVKKMINDYANAFNQKDLNTVIGYWTEKGVHIDRESNERTEGREAIKEDLATAFADRPGTKLLGRIESIRFVKPDVASVVGDVTISNPGADPTHTAFSAILVSSDGKWMIDEIEESPVPVAPSSYDALQDLEWLIGRWVDDGEQTRVDTMVRWAANQAFLLRSFTVSNADGETFEGTQVIGWDPRSREIRSWTFQGDGGFGDATWTKSGDDWLVKSSQTLPDGRAASGTFVYTPVGDDEISVRLIGHEIEGEPQPAGGSVTIRRVVEVEAEPAADAANSQ